MLSDLQELNIKDCFGVGDNYVQVQKHFFAFVSCV